MSPGTVQDLGPLAPFHDAGVLGLPDVHVAAALMRIGGTPTDGQVALGAALCVRALRMGSVCLDLDADPATWAADAQGSGGTVAPEPPAAPAATLPWPDPEGWREALRRHPLVADGPAGPPDRPLRLVGSLLYLQRYWADEQLVGRELQLRARLVGADPAVLAASLARLFPDPGPDAQRLAAATAALRGVTIVAGGPGTGKTTTVARLIAVVRALDPSTTIGLAAPTGKAAARLQEAIATAVATMAPEDRERIGEVPAATLHRLLGWRPGGRFRHDRATPLPHDLVVVDETSMVSLPLMARLLEAVRADARLVLVGDPDQLASVDAGAVLGDLVAAPPDWSDPAEAPAFAAVLRHACPTDPPSPSPGVVLLTRNFRFEGAIARLAEAVRAGEAERAVDLLGVTDAGLEFLDTTVAGGAAAAEAAVRRDVVAQAAATRAASIRGDARAALTELERHRVLCAHRAGPAGVAHWSALIAAWTSGEEVERLPAAAVGAAPSWPGRPLLVTANDYAAEVYNGDTGVVVVGPDGQLRAAFARGAEPVLVPPARLEHVETLHAMTIHRGQGSQFDTVTVVLPGPESPLLTRELLYTAITRARRRIRIVGSTAAVRAAVQRPVRRASGLRARLGRPAPRPRDDRP